MSNNFTCRLCDGTTSPKFSLAVLGAHIVQYIECAVCGALQTEPPYWLDQAYCGDNLSNLDTGSAQRNLRNVSACLLVSRIFKLQNVIDMGGGDGLLCRMLRDFGLNCYVKDKYANPTYAQGFTLENFVKPDLITAFEVIEHLPNPKFDLSVFFETTPQVLLFSTVVYNGESSKWWYLSAESGQHVFFYSMAALELIAKRYGYVLIISGGFQLFIRSSNSQFKIWLVRVLLNERFSRLAKCLVMSLPTPGVWKDYRQQLEVVRRLHRGGKN